MKRLAIVEVADAFLDRILRVGTEATEVISDPLPSDAHLVAVHYDGRTIRLTYQSESFAPVADGAAIPLLAPKYALKCNPKGVGP